MPDNLQEKAEVPGLTDKTQKPPSLIDYIDHHYSTFVYKRSHYLDILFELENVYPKFSSYIFNTGMPVFIEDPKLCPTAAVTYNLITKCVKYFWNISFFDTLQAEEIKFVMIHETMHLLLGHPLWSRHMKFKEIWNIACDAVINDLIVKDFKDVSLPDWVITGQKCVGQDCSGLSAEKVYDMILQNATFFTISINGVSVNPDDVGDEDDGAGEEGNEPKYTIEFNEDFNNADDHTGWTDIPTERIEQIVKQTKNIFDSTNQKKNRGTEESIGDRLVYKKKNQFSLRRYIKNIVAHKVDEEFTENWRRYNPKMATVYPDIILPYSLLSENKNIIDLTFMIDVSGSVPNFLIDEFVAIARQHAKDHDCTTCSFDTAVHKFDLRTMEKIPGGGGTSFEAVVDWVVKENSKYDIVFVLTDGWGGPIDPKLIDIKKWFWVISPNGSVVDKSYGVSVKIPHEYINRNRSD